MTNAHRTLIAASLIGLAASLVFLAGYVAPEGALLGLRQMPGADDGPGAPSRPRASSIRAGDRPQPLARTTTCGSRATGSQRE
ncbi:hypothetical protein AEGHOMDF_5834 [Methylobacterium soli]|uniref:hypothetical protein n=1 Tax=Methylobacterium soli TaxID=553447 RepID=UPI001EE26F42|nr:hypothetical protein [Methylobacterium soli]GJE46627.1 hypothetical protein AEGHOMDF_5834 [Methylobacterium soli]